VAWWIFQQFHYASAFVLPTDPLIQHQHIMKWPAQSKIINELREPHSVKYTTRLSCWVTNLYLYSKIKEPLHLFFIASSISLRCQNIVGWEESKGSGHSILNSFRYISISAVQNRYRFQGARNMKYLSKISQSEEIVTDGVIFNFFIEIQVVPRCFVLWEL
jgi:hypothetical protein